MARKETLMKKHNNNLKIYTNADMSHQNTLWFQISLFIDSIKLNGIGNTLKRLSQRLYYKYKGIDFSTQNLHNLTLTGEYQTHGTALVSSSKYFFQRVFSELESIAGKKIEKNLFIDYGSGKGAAIIHAKNLGFNETIGIEFAKELHETALSNIRKLGLTKVTSLYQDATTFIPPPYTSVIYFFNPFDEVVMEKVAQNIKQQQFMNDVYIIYGRPTCSMVLDRYFTLLGTKEHESGAIVNYYKV
jgi:16S rRNA G966 N2-methylase RsmD